MLPDEELLTCSFLPIRVSKMVYDGAFAYVSFQKKGTEDIVVMEFGEVDKNEERNHVAYRKNMEIATNEDGTKFQRLRGNYFHRNIIRVGSNDGMNFKLISEKYVRTKVGKSDGQIAPHVGLRFLWNRNNKTIQLFVQIEGKEFPLN
jgi:hypothetical protein